MISLLANGALHRLGNIGIVVGGAAAVIAFIALSMRFSFEFMVAGAALAIGGFLSSIALYIVTGNIEAGVAVFIGGLLLLVAGMAGEDGW